MIFSASVKLPRDRFNDDILPKVPPGQPPPLDFSILLTSAEEMYAELRDLHINAVGAKLSEKTKRISAAYEVCDFLKFDMVPRLHTFLHVWVFRDRYLLNGLYCGVSL